MANFTRFLGLGPRRSAAEQRELARAGDDEARRNKKTRDSSDDEQTDEERQEDEEDDDEDSEDEREAKRRRNALRAAGHRRGVAAEQSRMATIFNGLDPDRCAVAVQLALDARTAGLPGEQIRALAEAAPLQPTERTAFGKIMDRVAAAVPGPGFSGSDDKKPPSLSGQMAEMVKGLKVTRRSVG
jgi:hypothetical protein